VNGSGTGLGGTADSFTYTYQVASGDFTFTTHMAITNWAWTGDRAGIMVRETLVPGARDLTIYQGDLGNRCTSFLTRSTVGGSSTSVGGNKFSFSPWYRLQRTGNVFTASQSTDGVTYGVIGTVALSTSVYVGFAVCSGAAGSFANITYENVTISGGGGGLPAAGTYSLLNRASGKMLDNIGSTADGAVVAQWADGTSFNQRWTLSYVGANAKLTCLTGGKCLDSIGHTADGSTVAQWTAGGSLNQQWTIQNLGTGYFKIINVANGKCLDTGGGTADGAQMQFWGSGGSFNQQWQFVTP
jgi:regulation of enolase protein 1 (concanavalin A-like superfamily)